jgi:O-antigen ligase
MTIIFWMFTLLIMLAPLHFGMVYALTQSVFACLVLGLAGILCLYQMINRSAPVVSLRRTAWETAAFIIVIGWAIVQMLSVTPAELHHPLWVEAGRALGQDIAGAISLSPGSGFQSLMRLVAYAGVFWLALQLGRDSQRARFFLDAFILAGTLYAIYGLVMNFDGFQKILWANKKSENLSVVTGTFVNRNNFATYMGIVLLCAVGAYLFRFKQLASEGRRGRDRIVAFFHASLVQGAFRVASILILLGALLLSASRAGITSSLLALVMMLLLYGSIQSAHRRFYGLMSGILMVAIVFTIFMEGDKFFQRMFETTLEHDLRLVVYEQTWQAIKSAPWTGFGLGSFEQAFPLYADIQTSQWDKAHGDWLEMIFELGWPGALLWFSISAGLVLRCLLGFFRRGRDRLYPLVACCAGLLVGLHALADFSLQIPGVAASFSALLGIGVAQSFSSREK